MFINEKFMQDIDYHVKTCQNYLQMVGDKRKHFMDVRELFKHWKEVKKNREKVGLDILRDGDE